MSDKKDWSVSNTVTQPRVYSGFLLQANGDSLPLKKIKSRALGLSFSSKTCPTCSNPNLKINQDFSNYLLVGNEIDPGNFSQ